MARLRRFRTLVNVTILSVCSFFLFAFIQTDVESDKQDFNQIGDGLRSRPIIKYSYSSRKEAHITNANINGDWNNVIKLKSNYSSLYHEYADTVDLRIIVITFNRPHSLYKTLRSLNYLITDGHNVSLEIWIDVATDGDNPDPETLNVARNFRWTNGPINIWVHTRHVGLFGQWLYTWRPRVDVTHELALLIEDDVDVSKYGYRWLRTLHERYQSRNDVACYTLQNDNAIGSRGEYSDKEIPRPKTSQVFLYRLPGSWAMAPNPQKWRQFQDWYEVHKTKSGFRPYVKEAKVHTSWYRIFEKQNRQDSMWTMWYIFYTSKLKQMCVYANLPTYTGRNDTSLSSNRKEVGLHFTKDMVADYVPPGLLTHWDDDYINFPDNPPQYDFNGSPFLPK